MARNFSSAKDRDACAECKQKCKQKKEIDRLKLLTVKEAWTYPCTVLIWWVLYPIESYINNEMFTSPILHVDHSNDSTL